MPSLIPTASVQDLGISSPPKWPMITTRNPEVKQRRADPEQPRLVKLGRLGGPSELVIAVSPDQAADQD
jgi:hypothetical protein